MYLQVAEREDRRAPTVRIVVPVTKTVSGFEGSRFLVAASAVAFASYAVATNATTAISFSCVYHSGEPDYDADFVSDLLAADAAETEAQFGNVVDMLDWLNRG